MGVVKSRPWRAAGHNLRNRRARGRGEYFLLPQLELRHEAGVGPHLARASTGRNSEHEADGEGEGVSELESGLTRQSAQPHA